MGQMNWEQVEPWDYAVIRVTNEYSKKYPMIEADDIKQEIYSWFAEHPNKLNEWSKLPPRESKNLIYRCLRNQALDYCQYWKAKSLGYDYSDLFYYEPDVVEALLPAILRGEWGVTHKLNLGRPGRPSAPSEGNNLQAMMIEIDSAYHKLSNEDKKLLFLRYAEAMEYADIAKEIEGGSSDAVRMRTTRAVRKLINKTGGFRPFVDHDFVEKQDSDESDDPKELGEELIQEELEDQE